MQSYLVFRMILTSAQESSLKRSCVEFTLSVSYHEGVLSCVGDLYWAWIEPMNIFSRAMLNDLSSMSAGSWIEPHFFFWWQTLSKWPVLWQCRHFAFAVGHLPVECEGAFTYPHLSHVAVSVCRNSRCHGTIHGDALVGVICRISCYSCRSLHGCCWCSVSFVLTNSRCRHESWQNSESPWLASVAVMISLYWGVLSLIYLW